jgi:hypothetical protein
MASIHDPCQTETWQVEVRLRSRSEIGGIRDRLAIVVWLEDAKIKPAIKEPESFFPR